MRRIFTLIAVACSLSGTAQTYFPGSLIGYTPQRALTNPSMFQDSTPGKKWFVSRYSGISTSFIFSKAGNATIVSAPVGIQLNRRLNNNLYAFGGVLIAPSYVNFNRSFGSATFNKSVQHNGFMRSNQLNLYSRAELGLMYVNDAKTFSISGSIGVETNPYPLLYPALNNTPVPKTINYPKR